MSQATIFNRIRSALAVDTENDAARRTDIATRLAVPPAHPRPAFARLSNAARDTRLLRSFAAQGTEAVEIENLSDLPQVVAALTRALGPATTLAVGDEEKFAGLAWPAAVAPQPWSPDETLGDGTAALSHALAAVAETGTLVLASGADNPASLALLPELHIVAVDRATVVPAFEDAFGILAARYGTTRFPRSVNLISGPSRTGDIGGRIVKGAHGPRRLAVVLYGAATPASDPPSDY